MNYSFPEEVSRIPVEQVVMKKLRNSMLWMAWGVLTTFVTILGALFNPQWLAMASHNYTWILLIELGVVFILGPTVNGKRHQFESDVFHLLHFDGAYLGCA